MLLILRQLQRGCAGGYISPKLIGVVKSWKHEVARIEYSLAGHRALLKVSERGKISISAVSIEGGTYALDERVTQDVVDAQILLGRDLTQPVFRRLQP